MFRNLLKCNRTINHDSFFYFYAGIGADKHASHTCLAYIALLKVGGINAFFINRFFCEYRPIRADGDAKGAALAEPLVNFNFSRH